jgi:hypothetical protein
MHLPGYRVALSGSGNAGQVLPFPRQPVGTVHESALPVTLKRSQTRRVSRRRGRDPGGFEDVGE